jgi:hypothetical protein
VEDIRLRGKQVLDEALGKIEPQVEKRWNFVTRKYEDTALGFEPTRDELAHQARKRLTKAQVKTTRYYYIADRKVKTFLHGAEKRMQEIFDGLVAKSNLDIDFSADPSEIIREMKRVFRGKTYLRTKDNVDIGALVKPLRGPAYQNLDPGQMQVRLQALYLKLLESTNVLDIDFEDLAREYYNPSARVLQTTLPPNVDLHMWKNDALSARKIVEDMPSEFHGSKARAYLKEALPGDAVWLDDFEDAFFFSRESGYQEGLADAVELFDFLEKRGMNFNKLEMRPKLRMNDLGPGTHGEWHYGQKTITVDFGVARHSEHVLNDISWSARTSHYAWYADTSTIYAHEYGHQLTLDVLTSEQKMRLWNKMMNEVDGIDRITGAGLEDISYQVYGDKHYLSMTDNQARQFLLFSDETIEGAKQGIAKNGKGLQDGDALVKEYWDAENDAPFTTDVYQFDKLLKDLFESPAFEPIVEEIAATVSTYAVTNWRELMAETFAQAITRSNSGPFGRAMLEFLEEEGIMR